MSGHHTDQEDNIHKEIFNPKTVLLCVVDELQPAIDSKNLSVQYFVEGQSDEVLTDPNIFRQIITDLFNHIVKHRPRGAVEFVLANTPR